MAPGLNCAPVVRRAKVPVRIRSQQGSVPRSVWRCRLVCLLCRASKWRTLWLGRPEYSLSPPEPQVGFAATSSGAAWVRHSASLGRCSGRAELLNVTQIALGGEKKGPTARYAADDPRIHHAHA